MYQLHARLYLSKTGYRCYGEYWEGDSETYPDAPLMSAHCDVQRVPEESDHDHRMRAVALVCAEIAENLRELPF